MKKHGPDCVCEYCSAERREMWRRGGLTDDWSPEKTAAFYTAVILLVCLLLTGLRMRGDRVDRQNAVIESDLLRSRPSAPAGWAPQ